MGLLFGKKKKRDWRPQVRCPRCGSNNVEVIGGGLQSYDSPIVTDVLGLGNTDWMNEYKCRDCGHVWDDWE